MPEVADTGAHDSGAEEVEAETAGAADAAAAAAAATLVASAGNRKPTDLDDLLTWLASEHGPGMISVAR